jgi:hypothetical protein
MRTAISKLLLALVMGVAMASLADATQPLTNNDVVQMVKAGLPESTILLSVRNSPANFSTAPADLIALKKAGVSQPVLDAIVTRSSGAATAPAPVPPPPGAYGAYGANPAGVVAIDGDRRVDLYMVAQYGSKSKMKLWSNEQVAMLPGTQAKIRLSSRTPSFEVPIPPNVDPVTMVRLMRLAQKGDTRQGSLRVNSFDPMFRKVAQVTEGVVPTSLVPLQSASAMPGMKRFTLSPAAPLEPGEYVVILYDSQMWDFGID